MTGHTRSFGAGGYDAFVVKYSSSGAKQWNLTWGGSNHDYGHSIAVDSEDNIVITGSTEPFGAEKKVACIVKYSSGGLLLWNATWAGFGSACGYDVAMDSANNIIITGQAYSLVEGIDDAFIVKYSPSGVMQWNRMWGGSYRDCGYGVAVDSGDNIVMAGETYSSVSDGTGAFVVKYSSLGVQLWDRVWGGSESDYGYGVAVDSNNNIFIAGSTESFGAGSSDVFIAKYPPSGFQFWHILWDERLRGDVDGDGDVDASDLFEFSEAYGSEFSKPNWNPNCDFNGDKKVDSSDLFDLSKNYGNTI